MSDTVKLIIEIPQYDYENIKKHYENSDVVESLYSYIYHGTLLDDVKAEIKENIATRESNKSMVQNVGLYLALEIIDNIGKESEE